MKMLHTCIRVGNLDASLKFYTEAIGLVETRRKEQYEHGFALVYLSDVIGGYELELTYNVGESDYVIGNGFSHIAVSVDNLESEYIKHQELGYEVSELKSLSGKQPNYYFVTDPDGYRVEVLRSVK